MNPTYNIHSKRRLAQFKTGAKTACHLKIDLSASNTALALDAVQHLLDHHCRVQSQLGHAQNREHDLCTKKITLELYLPEGAREGDFSYEAVWGPLFAARIVAALTLRAVPACFWSVYRSLTGSHGIKSLEVHNIPLQTENVRSHLIKPIIRSFGSLTLRGCELVDRDLIELLDCAVERQVRHSEHENRPVKSAVVVSVDMQRNNLTAAVLPAIITYATTRLSLSPTTSFEVFLKHNPVDLETADCTGIETLLRTFPGRFHLDLAGEIEGEVEADRRMEMEVELRATSDAFKEMVMKVERDDRREEGVYESSESLGEGELEEKDIMEDELEEKEKDGSPEDGSEEMADGDDVAMEEQEKKSKINPDEDFEKKWKKEFSWFSSSTPHSSFYQMDNRAFAKSLINISRETTMKQCKKCGAMMLEREMKMHQNWHRNQNVISVSQSTFPLRERKK